MKSKEVYQALQNKYSEERYMLQNSYVFDWESDFFFRTASKLFVEVEVKISKADFRKDFTKLNKHETLTRTFNGDKTILIKKGITYSYEYDEEVYVRPRVYDKVTGKPIKTTTGRRLKSTVESSGGYLTKFLSTLKNPTCEENSCKIEIKPLSLTPNKFYYACPEGLIQKEEVPKYAGLIWIVNGVAEIVKKAPTIRKDKINLDNVLLEKFYWKCKKLENGRN